MCCNLSLVTSHGCGGIAVPDAGSQVVEMLKISQNAQCPSCVWWVYGDMLWRLWSSAPGREFDVEDTSISVSASVACLRSDAPMKRVQLLARLSGGSRCIRRLENGHGGSCYMFRLRHIATNPTVSTSVEILKLHDLRFHAISWNSATSSFPLSWLSLNPPVSCDRFVSQESQKDAECARREERGQPGQDEVTKMSMVKNSWGWAGVGIDVPFWGFWTSPNQIFVGYCIPNSRVMWNIGTFGNRCSIVIPCVFVDLLEITYWIVWFLLLSMWFRIRSLELWFCCCKYVFGRFVIESLVSLGVLCSHMNKTWVYLCGFLIPGLGLVQAPTNKKCAP